MNYIDDEPISFDGNSSSPFEEEEEKKPLEEEKNLLKTNAIEGLSIKLRAKEEFSYAEYHADGLSRASKSLPFTPFSFIESIEVINDTGDTIPGLSLCFQFEHEAFSIDDVVLPPCPSPAGFIRLPFLQAKKPLLDGIVSKMPSAFTASLVRNGDNAVLATVTHHFIILPHSQTSMSFYDDRRLFAKYVTPLDPHIKQLANKAVVYHGGEPLVAYQNKDVADILGELKAVYEVLHDENILYQNPVAGDDYAQRVRLSSEVLNDKKATCLDSSLLFCSLLCELGFHPVLVFIDGHAFVGVFLREKDELSGGYTDKIAEITKRVGKTAKTMALIETTLVTTGHTSSFQDAMDAGEAHLRLYEGKIFAAIDVAWCHNGEAYSPIPVYGDDFELLNYIKQKQIEDRDLNPIVNKDYSNLQYEFQLDRFKIWERKLLDLTEKNKLVRFSTDPRNAIRLMSKNLIQALSSNESVSLALAVASQQDIAAAFMTTGESAFKEYLDQIDAHCLLAFGLESTLKSLMRKAKSALEETGASPLYLSLGLLSFISPKTRTRIHAPFVLLPVSIKKEAGGKGYSMVYDLGDIKINETVFEYLKLSNPDLNFSTLYHFDDLSKYDDLVNTFKQMSGEDIAIEEDYFFLSNLSFAHQVMWLDIVKRRKELEKNIIISSIVDNQSHLEEEVIPDDESIENLERYEDFAAPLYYDSSQLKAILDCGKGKSFILDGPPGTGKSQTIVNMIANAFYNGKKVLFVAEKKAALDVVADRLEKLGLGAYCLELHSNKANKSDFFAKLGQTMEFGPSKPVEEYEAQCIALTQKKNALRQTINKMHEKRKGCLSLYDCIIATKQLAYLEDYKVDFDPYFIEKFDDNAYHRACQLFDSYISLASGISHFESTPLKAFGITEINFLTDRDIIAKQCNEHIQAIESFLDATKSFSKSIPFPFAAKEPELSYFLALLKDAYEGDFYLGDILDLYSRYEEVKSYLAKMRKMAKKKEEISKSFDIDAFLSHVEVSSLAEMLSSAKGIFGRAKAQKVIKNAFKPYAHFELLNEQLGSIIYQIKEYRQEKEAFIKDGALFVTLTKLDPYQELQSIDAIETKFQRTYDFLSRLHYFAEGENRREIMMFFRDLLSHKDPYFKMDLDAYLAKKAEYEKTLRQIDERFAIHQGYLSMGGDYNANLIKLLRLGADKSNFDDLSKLASLNRVAKGIAQEGLGALIDQVVLGLCRSDELYDLLRISLSYGALKLYFQEDDINSFSSSFFNEEVRRYKDMIKLYSETTVSCIASRISASFARNDIRYASTGAIGRLKKAVASSGRGVSIRGTLSEFGDVILRYFPCFLMSPLSAAQYLSVDADFSKFDIVIFDEASQIPTHEAIGPIARGNSLIVAGDPKQMPPSPYFSAGLQLSEEEEEDSDFTKFSDSPSLLDECIAITMPRHRLMYHYRSKHESLIQFSNINFYNSGLFTFPSSSTSSSCVKFVHVSTKVAKTDSSLSKEELDVILKTFKEIYTNPSTKKKSLGIICFNIKQADKIADAINEMLGNDKVLDEAVEEASSITQEPWFVKSIENVQGDERDIIVLSVGFSCAKTGYPVIRGPLVAGDNNGERRLNVAASRAKEQMIVISTIRSSQFPSDEAIKNPGAKCLKHFLKFAEDASFNLNSSEDIDESSILYYIKSDLEERGYTVETNVGSSQFRVDLALRHKESDHYELGVLVDTRPIDHEISCRDKFYVQEAVLNRMKWKIIHVYALEYFKYREDTLKRIEEAFNEDYHPQEDILDIHIEKDDAQIKENVYGALPYELPTIYPIVYDNVKGYDNALKGLLTSVINALSPISYNSIKKIVGEACEFKAFNAEREQKLKAKLRLYFPRDMQFDGNQYFFWSSSVRHLDNFRYAGGRDVNDIALEEIVAAMESIISVQGRIDKNELYKALMEAFAFPTSTLTAHYKDRFELAYTMAESEGRL